MTAPSIIFVVWAKIRLETGYAWEHLPFKALVGKQTEKVKKRHLTGEYVQPGLIKS